MHTRQRGVTLIELMIVIIVIAILASIALPSYRNYVIRSQRVDAKNALLSLATAQEKFYLQCNRYAAAFGAADSCVGNGTIAFGNRSERGWYDIAVTAATNTDFTLTATARADEQQAADAACRVFRVTGTGVRTASNSGGTDNTVECWR